MILEALLLFMGGLSAAGHCLGMCGGFVLTLGAGATSLGANFRRQLVYALGRVSAYVLGGAIVGYVGFRLAHALPSVAQAQAFLALAGGAVLVVQGLVSAGALPWFGNRPVACPFAGTFAALLRAGRLRSIFVAGAANALLPCALVYAYLALAASTAHMLYAAVVMLLFGLGTIPPLVLLGLGGGLLGTHWRLRLLRLAAVCVIITGCLTMARGCAYLNHPAVGEQACPFCTP